VAPPAIGLDEQSNPFRFHEYRIAEDGPIIKWEMERGICNQ
jgi:hypothetical protein